MKVSSRTYTLSIERGDDAYVAYFPALPACHTWGKTYEAAVRNAEEALGVYLETLAAHGDPIPEDQALDEPVSLGVTVRTARAGAVHYTDHVSRRGACELFGECESGVDTFAVSAFSLPHSLRWDTGCIPPGADACTRARRERRSRWEFPPPRRGYLAQARVTGAREWEKR